MGLLLPRVTSFPNIPLFSLLIAAEPIFSAKWARLQPSGWLSDFLNEMKSFRPELRQLVPAPGGFLVPASGGSRSCWEGAFSLSAL